MSSLWGIFSTWGIEPLVPQPPVMAGNLYPLAIHLDFPEMGKNHMLETGNTGTEQREAENMKDGHTHVHTPPPPHYTQMHCKGKQPHSDLN